jgi:hypothetical protein
MPCRSDGWDAPSVPRSHGMSMADFEAAMCGVFTAAESGAVTGGLAGILDVIDWDEAGVKRKTVEKWWKEHKAADERRRAREAAEKRKAELRKIAIGKLSPEELEILGIKY